MPTRLRDTAVLVTRPRHQAAAFCAMIERAGGRAVRFPVIEIKPIAPAREAIAAISNADAVIFASANAARLGAALVRQAMIQRRGGSRTARATFQVIAQIIAMGPATAAQLKAQSIEPTLTPPSPYNSEALLAMLDMRQPSGHRYVIIKGEGGRKHLADSLRRRGALASEINIYIRAKPNAPNIPIDALMQARRPVVAVTSVKGLRHLFEMATTAQTRWLKQHAEFLLPGDRLATTARQMRIQHPLLIAENATDAAMFERLTAG